MRFDTALIDADVLLYSVCRGNERDADFGDMHILYSDFSECVDIIKNRIEELVKVVDADKYALYVSDSANWRKDVMPSYKNHRKDARKPLAFHRLKDYLCTHHLTFTLPRLEADDVLGMDSDSSNIIISLDKDFFAVEGNFGRIAVDGSVTVHTVTENQARYNHFVQAFMGDRTDGYPGCPGIGPVSARKKINKVVSVEDEVSQTEALNVWKMMVHEYEIQGLGPEVVHENFMVSKILDGRTGTYDYGTGEVSIKLPTGVTLRV